jgi:hypothetical protein
MFPLAVLARMPETLGRGRCQDMKTTRELYAGMVAVGIAVLSRGE